MPCTRSRLHFAYLLGVYTNHGRTYLLYLGFLYSSSTTSIDWHKLPSPIHRCDAFAMTGAHDGTVPSNTDGSHLASKANQERPGTDASWPHTPHTLF